MSRFLEVAADAARTAGKFLLENRGRIPPDQITEKAKNDFVTRIDQQSEEIILKILHDAFPDHQIVAEEGSRRRSDSPYRWFVDPLDGTTNFIQNLPMFAVSIALLKESEVLCGVVYDPVHDELFQAERGQGAFCNGKPIRVSQENNFSRAVIATGFPHRRKIYLPDYLLTFNEIFLRCSGMRRCGSAALDLCYTAAGRYEGYWELGLSPWDVAAGSLLVSEAGGKVSDFWNRPDFLKSGFIVAGNPSTHARLIDFLKIRFQPENNLGD